MNNCRCSSPGSLAGKTISELSLEDFGSCDAESKTLVWDWLLIILIITIVLTFVFLIILVYWYNVRKRHLGANKKSKIDVYTVEKDNEFFDSKRQMDTK